MIEIAQLISLLLPWPQQATFEPTGQVMLLKYHSDPVTPLFSILQWLPVTSRVKAKVLTTAQELRHTEVIWQRLKYLYSLSQINRNHPF